MPETALEINKGSYRQIGGRVVREHARGGTSNIGVPRIKPAKNLSPRMKKKRTPASIPSKFETTLIEGARESDAFGTRVNRFRENLNELPGPGYYAGNLNDSTLLRDAKTCGSISQKGYGVGFVSKTQRFNRVNDLASQFLPGPGSYDASSSTLLEKKDFSKLPATSSFVPPLFKDENPETEDTGLGPGCYDPYKAMSKQVKNKSSVFKSKSKRGFNPQKDGPAPGDYENILPNFKKKSDLVPTAAYRSKTKRDSMNSVQDLVKPGPGKYDWESSFEKLYSKDNNHKTSVFSNSKMDRFGNHLDPKSIRDSVPGPGAYHMEKKIVAGSVSSVFLSNTKRGEAKIVRPPGPAYYNPKAVDPKSFLLNSKGKWV